MRLIQDICRSTPVHILLLPLCFFVVIPAYFAKVNLAELGYFDVRAFLIFFAFAVTAFLILALLNFGYRKLSGRDHFSKFLEFSLFVVLITGFFLPASVGTGMVDPRSLAVNGLHIFVALVLAGIMMALSARHRGRVYQAVIAFLVINSILILPAIHTLWVRDNKINKSVLELSSNKNIIVLSFDGISGPIVSELLQEHSELRATLAGFVFFDRAASSSPSTSASIFTSLYGNGSFKQNAETEGDLWSLTPENLITNQLRAGGYNLSTYGVYNRGNLDPASISSPLTQRFSSSPNLLDYAIARMITRHFVTSGALRRYIKSIFDSLLVTRSGDEYEYLSRIYASYSPVWKKEDLTPTVLDFREYVDKLHVRGREPAAQFLHFTHTHFPVEFDRYCRFMGDSFEWFHRSQNRHAVKEETYCALQQFSRFLTKLKELNVFDRTLIVLKSDHGKPVEYQDPSKMESFKIRGHKDWGYGRYLPFLAIKDFGEESAEVRFDLHPVLLDDLAKTLCIRSNLSANCSVYSGYDLLADDFEEIEKDRVSMFVVKSSESTFQYDTHDAVSIERGAHIVESLFAVMSREYLSSGVRCGATLNVLDAKSLNNGNSDFESWMTWRNGGASYLRFRNDSECTSARLQVRSGTPSSFLETHRVFANGKLIDGLRPEGLVDGAEVLISVPVPLKTPGTLAEVLIEIRPVERNSSAFVQILGVEFGSGRLPVQ